MYGTRFFNATTLRKKTFMIREYCMGIKCPIKKQCLRYTKGLVVTEGDGTKDKYVRNCTNQRKFLQDDKNINPDSKNATKV